jgi:hypothetical protein
VKYQPVLQTAASGEARFDHDPVTGESKGLLIEEARTNLAPYSQTLDSGQWAKNNVTVTADASVAPDGTLTADLMQQGTSTDYMIAEDYLTLSADTVYTASTFIKYAGDIVEFGVFDSTAGHMGRIDFNASVPSISLENGTDCGYEDVGNGWYRIWVSFTSGSTLTNSRIRYLLNSGQSGTGDGWSGVLAWGAQLEVGSFPTSYIPTSGSTVTRASEQAFISGDNFSSFFSNQVGTIYCEYGKIHEGDPTIGERLVMVFADDETVKYNLEAFRAEVRYSTGWSGVSFTNRTRDGGKVVMAFDETGFSGGSLGTLFGPVTLQPYANPSVKMYIGSAIGNSHTNACIPKVAYYPKRLPNTTLQAMTEA